MRKLILTIMPLLVCLAVGAQSKPIVTVLDLKTSGVSESDMKAIVSLLSSKLFQTGKYTMIDVAERDTLMKEIEFSAQDCTDEKCQVEIGKMLAAEFIVVGSLSKVGARLVLSLKILETSTSRTSSTADGMYANLDALLDDLGTLTATLVGLPAQPGQATPSGTPVAPKPARAAVAKPVPWKPILSVAGIAAGIGTAGVGGYFLYNAFVNQKGPMDQAFESYMALLPGTAQTTIDETYASYLSLFQDFKGKLTIGGILAGGGIAVSALSVLILRIPAKDATATAAILPGPRAGSVVLALRVSY